MTQYCITVKWIHDIEEANLLHDTLTVSLTLHYQEQNVIVNCAIQSLSLNHHQ